MSFASDIQSPVFHLSPLSRFSEDRTQLPDHLIQSPETQGENGLANFSNPVERDVGGLSLQVYNTTSAGYKPRRYVLRLVAVVVLFLTRDRPVHITNREMQSW